MSSGPTGDDPISGYSTRAGVNGDTDGYRVVINAENLAAAMDQVAPEVQGKSDRDLASLVLQNTVETVVWGNIPNAKAIHNELSAFVQQHAEAMAQMRQGTLHDFVQRVLAAAEIGYDADPATKAQARQAQHRLAPN